MQLQRPRAILFDWDNTLVDTWTVIHRALGVTFEAMGMLPWTLQETRQRVRRSARETFPELFGERAEEAAEIFYRSFETEHLQVLKPLPGVPDMLEELGALAELHLAVVSNKQGYLLRREAHHLGWDRIFHSLVGASDAELDKPACEAVTLALAKSGVDLGPDVWFVGDTDVDMTCAHNCGCTAVLLRSEAPRVGEFADCPPAVHLCEPAQLSTKLSEHFVH